MGFCVTEIYPKVVASHSRHTLYFRLEGEVTAPEVRLSPMEIYGVSHYPDYWSHHADRYPWVALTDCGEGLYSAELDFAEEQRYCVKFRVGEEISCSYYLYAVEPDLAVLRPYKGDTHLHTNRSDGHGEPFEVACAYRAAGYDFIAVTDHGRYAPSDELQAEMGILTDCFYGIKTALLLLHPIAPTGCETVREYVGLSEKVYDWNFAFADMKDVLANPTGETKFLPPRFDFFLRHESQLAEMQEK